MLPDHVLELLTAAVDGELSPADRDRCRRVRAESPAADALYRRLKADRSRVRRLPITLPPAGLHERIMAGLPPVATPAVLAARPRVDRRLAWAGLAASVALAAGVAAFLAGRPVNRLDQVVAQAPPPNRPTPLPSDPRPVQPIEEPLPALPGPEQRGTPVVPAPAGPDRLANEPRPVRPDVAASPPVAPPAGFARAAIRVPLLVPVADLSREDAREPLLDALRQDSAARVDLFARDTARAIELLQAAAKAAGLTVHADAPTLDRARRRPGATYLLYTDTLTPAEVVDLLAGLADADAAGPTPVFDAAHVTPAGPADAKELKDTLGVDLGSAKRAAGVDPAAGGRPIAAGTSGELSKGITTLRAGDKPAALTPLPPPGTRPAAPPRELRQLLDAGSPRKPAALPLLLVVRPAAG